MNLTETTKLLTLLARSESKVQIWMRLDGKLVNMTHDSNPILASDALIAVKAAHDTANDFGVEATFSLSRWDW